MQLLFNKIYLKIDHLFKAERNRINISPRVHSGVLAGGFRQTANEIEAVAPFHHASSYTDLIANDFGGDETAFLRELFNYPAHQRLTIYCDVDTYVELCSRFWKTLYPQLGADDYFRLVNFTLSPLYEILAHHKSRESALSDTNASELRTEILTAFDKEAALKKAWPDVEPFKLTREQREIVLKSVGVEYHLPTMLITEGWRHATGAKRRIVDMTLKAAIADFIQDVKHILLNNLENIYLIDAKCKYNALKDTLEDFVADHPDYLFLADPMFTPDNLSYVLSTYDLTDLERIRMLVLEHDGYEADSCGVPLQTGLSFNDILEWERSGTMGRVLANTGEYREKVNPYMIDYVLTNYLAGNTEAIQPYTLR